MADNGKICIHLVFTRGNSASIQNKVHEFWSFLDTDRSLQSAYGECVSKPPKQRTLSNVSVKSICSTQDCEARQRIWHQEFKAFRNLGLDKAALAIAGPCKKCPDDTRCSDYADTVETSYEELSEEMEAFDRRTGNL